MKKPKVIAFKISGVLVPVSFQLQQDQFFIDNLPNYLNENWSEPEVKELVNKLREQSVKDNEKHPSKFHPIDPKDDADAVQRSVIEYCKEKLKQNGSAINTPFNEMKVLVWANGYKSGSLKVVVFEDVPETLALWKESHIHLFTISSAPLEAQENVFKSSEKGDLSKYLVGGFLCTRGLDTQHMNSFKKIASRIGEPESDILFLSDNKSECKSATLAGLNVILVERELSKPVSPEDDEVNNFRIVSSLKEIVFEADAPAE